MAFEPIEDTKLEDLVKVASLQLLDERRHEATNLIKNFFQKLEGLVFDVKKLRSELAKKEESLAKTEEKIKRLQSGDWSVLEQNQNPTKADSEH